MSHAPTYTYTKPCLSVRLTTATGPLVTRRMGIALSWMSTGARYARILFTSRCLRCAILGAWSRTHAWKLAVDGAGVHNNWPSLVASTAMDNGSVDDVDVKEEEEEGGEVGERKRREEERKKKERRRMAVRQNRKT